MANFNSRNQDNNVDQNIVLQRASSILRTALNELETSASSSRAASASEDFRAAFPGLSSRNVVRPRVSAPRPSASASYSTKPVRSSSGFQPMSKKQKPLTGYMPLKFVPTDTWTHDVCVLSRCDEDVTPSQDRLDTLMDAGLGKKSKVVFPNNKAGHEEFQSFLEEKYPKLKKAGGFEVLRASGGGGGQRPLRLVTPSREGYTVPHLKERLGQAIAYIRPLQQDLNETPVDCTDDGPSVTCITCFEEFTYSALKMHKDVCAAKGKDDKILIAGTSASGSAAKCMLDAGAVDCGALRGVVNCSSARDLACTLGGAAACASGGAVGTSSYVNHPGGLQIFPGSNGGL